MPELPDIELYLTRLRERVVGRKLQRARVFSPFVLRSVEVAPAEMEGRAVYHVFRLGKRLVLELEEERFVLIHLMIAGRLQWQSPPPPEKGALGKMLLAAFTFENGRLSLVEGSSRKRAAIYLLSGREGLEPHERGGLDVLACDPPEFVERLRRENRTLKRVLTSPQLFDGIGNAYSDEVLFAARLSPLRMSRTLTDDEARRLCEAARDTLSMWRDRLQEQIPEFPRPQQVTAFRPDFAAHGRYGKPCPACGAPIQRIVYAENETNYCAVCQNEGRLLADRSLSRLLKDDWPKTVEEMVEGRA